MSAASGVIEVIPTRHDFALRATAGDPGTTVIPGRGKGASPESIIPSLAKSACAAAVVFMDSGLLPRFKKPGSVPE
jgi:hypothetical protein